LSKPQDIELAALTQVGELLKFAAENAKSISADVVSTIASAWEARDNDTWSPDISAKFWTAYNSICSTINPVTLDTIASNAETVDRRRWLHRRGGERTSPAKRAAEHYLAILLAALLIAIVLQFIVSTATNLQIEINKTVTDSEPVITKISQQLATLSDLLPDKDFAALTPSAEQKKTIADLNTEFQQVFYLWDQRVTKLRLFRYVTFRFDAWNVERGSLKPYPNLNAMNEAVVEFYTDRREFTDALERGMFIVKITNVTILPLLFGLIGACAYVTRLISDQIKDTTFSSTSPVRHRVRAALGALAGVVVGFGWIGSGISLQPLALAFAAGYAVEPVFATIDGISDKFRKTT
jgi:uncharacterized coiled-coil protein SlyX